MVSGNVRCFSYIGERLRGVGTLESNAAMRRSIVQYSYANSSPIIPVLSEYTTDLRYNSKSEIKFVQASIHVLMYLGISVIIFIIERSCPQTCLNSVRVATYTSPFQSICATQTLLATLAY